MTRKRADSLIVLMLGAFVFLLHGVVAERSSVVSMADFKVIYFGSRCLLEHSDPYNPSEMNHVFLSEGGESPADSPKMQRFWYSAVAIFVYLPSSWFLALPFALLPLSPAIALWMVLTAVLYLLAAYLTLAQANEDGILMSAVLMAVFIANSAMLLEIGNAAGFAVSLCAIAVWCLLREKYEMAGVVCLASGVPGKICTSGSETNWYGRSKEWARQGSTHLSR